MTPAFSTVAPPNARHVHVYAGKHYGRRHRLIQKLSGGRLLVADPEGREIAVPQCDTDYDLPAGAVSSVPTPSGTSLASPEASGPLRATPAGIPGAVPPFPTGAQTVPICLRGPAIVTVCAWCQSVQSVTLSPLFSKTMISHGICARCAKEQRE